jgi:mannan endo-1,4-beta-mannosidase
MAITQPASMAIIRPARQHGAVMRVFFDETAALIKSLDPNRLVGTGAQAEYVSGTTDYAFVHGGPNIDVGSLHEYDYGFEDSRTIISGHFAPTLAAMNSINKPLYIGETGVDLTNTCLTAQDRAGVLVQKFDGYLGGDAAGVLYWNWVSNPNTACGADVGPPTVLDHR